MALFRPVALGFFRRLIRLFFRQIEVVDAPSRDVRGRLFAATHPSGLVDPIIVTTAIESQLSPIAKSTLWEIPFLRWLLDAVADAVPISRKQDGAGGALVDNEHAFDKIADRLKAGGNILIFPEGVSHAEPKLMPIKTGGARMLLRAYERGARGLTYQAIAIELDARETFRSRALVLHGPVRAADAIVDDASIAPENRARAITTQLAEDLSALSVEASSAQEREVMARASLLFAAHVADGSLTSWSEIARRASRARRGAGAAGDATFEAVATRVEAYFQALSDAGVRDVQISGAREPGVPSDGWLYLAAPLAIVGAMFWWLPYRLPRLAHRWAKGERDVVSTYKIAIGMFSFPVWAVIAVLGAFAFGGVRVGLVIVGIVVATPSATLAWVDRVDRIGGLFPRAIDAATRARLGALRADAIAAIDGARAFVEAHERGEIGAIKSPATSA